MNFEHISFVKQKVVSNNGIKFVRVPHDFNEDEVILLSLNEYKRLCYLIKRFKALKMLLDYFERGRIFNLITQTWNPVTGCLHNCIYCWARKLATEKLRNVKRYKNGFLPRLNRDEFKKKFKSGCIFVTDMGDLFGDFIPKEWIEIVLNYIRRFKNAMFLFLTKNPKRYLEFIDEIPENVILGATIETNIDEDYERISKAPKPSERIKIMKELDWDFKFISIEPILKFDSEFPKQISEINPFIVYIGYDNYNNRLPEPKLCETLNLIKNLESEGIVVLKGTIRCAWYESKT